MNYWRIMIFKDFIRKHVASGSRFFIFAMIFVSLSCVESYSPKLDVGEVDILVVDGFLDTSDSTVVVKLSKANVLGGDTALIKVEHAVITVESNEGSSYDVVEQSPGIYHATEIPVDPLKQYRVHVSVNNAEYESDFEGIKKTPEIDSITWKPGDGETRIYVNAHDATNSTHYYRWDYTETYEYNAGVFSAYKFEGTNVVARDYNDYIFTCWKTTESSSIHINSTVQLQSDVVRDFNLIRLPVGTIKLSQRYSVLVKQRALSESEYDFLDQLDKTTESIGSLFDPQPSQVPGNIHSLTAGANALGYFSAGNSTSKRFFVAFYELPEALRKVNEPYCGVDTICVRPRAFLCVKDVGELDGTELIGAGIYDGGSLIGYTLSYPFCADCRTQGGVLQKPSFWP
ncbi:MAG: DUF4249 domain-containing protein [Chryseolinea sp.]